MSINLKSMISAISPVQKSEIECKTVKLIMIDNSDKNKMADKNKTKIETLYLNYNTKTS